jgi:hypothetical protein
MQKGVFGNIPMLREDHQAVFADLFQLSTSIKWQDLTAKNLMDVNFKDVVVFS